MKIPENADWPPQINDIPGALASIDVAYHMNHRINKEPLFNPETGVMKEGIGHYGFEKISDNEIKMVCSNPYTCDFDRGIIEAAANKFKSNDSQDIRVRSDDSHECRKKDGDSCSYYISW